MKIYYISPSTIPSRAANSIHVVYMCEGLAQLGHSVVLFAHSGEKRIERSRLSLLEHYGVESTEIDPRFIPNFYDRGIELFIALRSVCQFALDVLSGAVPDRIVSRNIFAATFLGLIFRRRVIYETHSPETGIRGIFQWWLLRSSKVSVVVISVALKEIICELHDVPSDSVFVLADAARAGYVPLDENDQAALRETLFPSSLQLGEYHKFIGYFGHLYKGRGLEVIEEAAKLLPDYAFLIYGGNEKQIEDCKARNTNHNVFFMGFLHPRDVRQAMSLVNAQVMPYQRSVSIGISGIDTAKWMSPMKLFEYLSMGVPIISSDLPVLREVLIDKQNCVLVTPDNSKEWAAAIKAVLTDNEFGERLGSSAYALYQEEHTWTGRAASMLKLFAD